jgi:hypothetical protein
LNKSSAKNLPQKTPRAQSLQEAVFICSGCSMRNEPFLQSNHWVKILDKKFCATWRIPESHSVFLISVGITRRKRKSCAEMTK